LEILILERLKVLRTVSKYSVAGSDPNTVLVAKSDTLGGACILPESSSVLVNRVEFNSGLVNQTKR